MYLHLTTDGWHENIIKILNFDAAHYAKKSYTISIIKCYPMKTRQTEKTKNKN